MLTTTSRIFKFAWQDFWRNIWLSIITITVLFFNLFLINFLIVFNQLTDTAINFVEDKVDLTVFFKVDAAEAKINEVKAALLLAPQVKEINYVSKEDALKNFKETHKDEPKILDALNEIGDNPLGASLIIKAYKTEDYAAIMDKLSSPDVLPDNLVQDKNFDDHKLLIEKISNIKNKTSRGGLILSGIFVLIAILIIFNTIRVAIYTHREEIGVMRLVGATSWFVRLPFIVEGMFYAIFACLLTFAVVYPLLGVIQPYLINFFGGTGFDVVSYYNQNFLKIFGLQLLGSIVLSVVSSALAVGKYLKV
jgi:cell division transport system permease protein